MNRRHHECNLLLHMQQKFVMTGSWSQCVRKSERGLSMNPRSRRRESEQQAENHQRLEASAAKSRIAAEQAQHQRNGHDHQSVYQQEQKNSFADSREFHSRFSTFERLIRLGRRPARLEILYCPTCHTSSTFSNFVKSRGLLPVM